MFIQDFIKINCKKLRLCNKVFKAYFVSSERIKDWLAFFVTTKIELGVWICSLAQFHRDEIVRV
jgi:hypothetical protein